MFSHSYFIIGDSDIGFRKFKLAELQEILAWSCIVTCIWKRCKVFQVQNSQPLPNTHIMPLHNLLNELDQLKRGKCSLSDVHAAPAKYIMMHVIAWTQCVEQHFNRHRSKVQSRDLEKYLDVMSYPKLVNPQQWTSMMSDGAALLAGRLAYVGLLSERQHYYAYHQHSRWAWSSLTTTSPLSLH